MIPEKRTNLSGKGIERSHDTLMIQACRGLDQLVSRLLAHIVRWLSGRPSLIRATRKLPHTHQMAETIWKEHLDRPLVRMRQLFRLYRWGWKIREEFLLEGLHDCLGDNYISPLGKRNLLRQAVQLPWSEDALCRFFQVTDHGRWLVSPYGDQPDRERASLASRILQHRNAGPRLWEQITRRVWIEKTVGQVAPALRKTILSVPHICTTPEVRTIITEHGNPQHLFGLLRPPRADWAHLLMRLANRRERLALQALKRWPDQARTCLSSKDWQTLLVHSNPELRATSLRLSGRARALT